MTKLRAESLHSKFVENHWGETDAVLIPVGRVVERPLKSLVFWQVPCRRRSRAGVPGRWAKATSVREVLASGSTLAPPVQQRL